MARPGLTKHPKFLRLVHMLGEPPAHVQGHLEFLWATAYEDGEPRIGDAVGVELAAGWDGKAGDLCKALLECGGAGKAGFIEEVPGEPGIFQVHDLFENAPEYVSSRFRMRRWRQRRQSEDHSKDAPQSPNGDVTQPLRNGYGSPAPAPKRKERAHFTKPTLEEVAAYCRERKNQVDPQRFVDYYTSNGWRVGRNPMKDWKAAVRTWERNDAGGNGQGKPKPDGKPLEYAF